MHLLYQYRTILSDFLSFFHPSGFFFRLVAGPLPKVFKISDMGSDMDEGKGPHGGAIPTINRVISACFTPFLPLIALFIQERGEQLVRVFFPPEYPVKPRNSPFAHTALPAFRAAVPGPPCVLQYTPGGMIIPYRKCGVVRSPVILTPSASVKTSPAKNLRP